ncbi:hypothetical protein ZOSMA_7415G00010 [Zostera marina]|uniref:Reverse transcriptase zinc-binding domain-containing protein n=1 Tax=Zostera marina TaxID=29655 RepID=A0A0K9NQA0_ZOSMR|nr:hypothetical protein ZOSMA_7415G00010 [Zostera marina]
MTMWRVNLRKITTQDKLIGWEYPQPKECWLCTTELESFDHIYFGCSYSRDVWRQIRRHIGDFLTPTDVGIESYMNWADTRTRRSPAWGMCWTILGSTT